MEACGQLETLEASGLEGSEDQAGQGPVDVDHPSAAAVVAARVD